MKKIILLALVFAVSGIMNAQTEQGNFVLGGSSDLGLNFGSTTFKSDAEGFEEGDSVKSTNINFSPIAGYFVMDNLAVGLIADINSNSIKDGSSENSFAAGPFLRYYFPMENVLPFVVAQGVFGSMNSNSGFEGSEDLKTNLTSIGGGAGIAIPLSDSVTFDIIAGYSSTTSKASDDNPDNYRNVIGNFGVNFGLLVIL